MTEVNKIKNLPLLSPEQMTQVKKKFIRPHHMIKLDFSKVIFTNWCCVILNSPDGWAKIWGLNGNNPQERKRRQEVGEGFII